MVYTLFNTQTITILLLFCVCIYGEVLRTQIEESVKKLERRRAEAERLFDEQTGIRKRQLDDFSTVVGEFIDGIYYDESIRISTKFILLIFAQQKNWFMQVMLSKTRFGGSDNCPTTRN